MIEFKILRTDVSQFQKAWWIYTILKFRLRSQTLQQHDIEPIIINVAKKFILRLVKDHDKLIGNIKFRLSNQRDYLEQLKSMQLETV
jgi:hypothetical protein